MKNSGNYKNQLNISGSILKKIRIEKNLSLEALSSKLLLLDVNIPVTCLHRIENNQRTVRDYELCALSIVLEVTPNDLLQEAIKKMKL